MKHTLLQRIGRTVMAMAAAGINVVSSVGGQVTQSHGTLTGLLGFPAYRLDSGWVGGCAGPVCAYLEFGGGIGGTLANVSMAGQASLAWSCRPTGGTLSFQGTDGTATMDYGIQAIAQYKLVIFGITYVGDLPFLPNADFSFYDSRSFTPYLLGSNLYLSDSFQDQQIIEFPFGIPGVANVHVGASLTANAQQTDRSGPRYFCWHFHFGKPDEANGASQWLFLFARRHQGQRAEHADILCYTERLLRGHGAVCYVQHHDSHHFHTPHNSSGHIRGRYERYQFQSACL